jgi:hypothetical protein
MLESIHWPKWKILVPGIITQLIRTLQYVVAGIWTWDSLLIHHLNRWNSNKEKKCFRTCVTFIIYQKSITNFVSNNNIFFIDISVVYPKTIFQLEYWLKKLTVILLRCVNNFSNDKWHESNDFGGYDCMRGRRQTKRIFNDKQSMWNIQLQATALAFSYILIENNLALSVWIRGKEHNIIYKLFLVI